MWQYSIKIAVSVIILVTVSEIAKRSSFWGATLASLPFTSLLAFIWLYLDTGDAQKIISLSQGIFWLVLPSLVLFITFPLLLRIGVDFWVSLIIACLFTSVAYLATIRLLEIFDINI